MTAPGYYADPWAEGGLRWWDGTAWTEHVATPAPAVVEPVVAKPGVFLPGDDVLPAAPAAPQVAPAPAFQPVVAHPAAAWAPAFAPAVARAAAPATYGFGVPADHGRSALPSWGYGAPGYGPAARRDDRPAWLVPTAIVSAVLLLVVLVGSWSASHRQVPAPQGDPAASDPAGVAQPGTVVGGDGGSSTPGGASGGDSIESSATLVAGPAVDTNPAVARRRTGRRSRP